MRTIYKYPLELTDRQLLWLPAKFQVISVREQHGKPCIWAIVDPDALQIERAVHVRGTGQEIPEGIIPLGTAHVGAFVWHVFIDAT